MRLQDIALAQIILLLSVTLASCKEEAKKSPYLEGSPPHYVNPYYGLDIAIPAGLTVCVDDGATMSHGFSIPLTKNTGCAESNPVGHPFISVFASSGAALDDVNTTEQLAQERCDRNSTRIDAPGWSVPGHDTAICREPYIYRDVDDKLVAPRGLIATTAHVWVAGAPPTELRVILVTNEERLPRDMETFKSVLDGIKSVGR